ncbi:MAG TPA: glycosyltransferase family A protein [Candidatus Nanoarchaeia archaeon]|nr:glycosyltransferase family A protein [Candidatus Nanoarchaeia archaeon]
MKISIIIPTLNEKDYLPRLINSIKKHTSISKRDYELIVVDGGSIDNTVSIARKLVNKVVVLKKRGIGFARNKGVKVASGDYLFFIDADTIIENDVITAMYTRMKESKRPMCGTVNMRVRLSGLTPRLIFAYINFVHKLLACFWPFAFGAFIFVDKNYLMQFAVLGRIWMVMKIMILL